MTLTLEEWDKLTASQKKGFEYGISELDEEKGLEYKMIMEDLMKKFMTPDKTQKK